MEPQPSEPTLYPVSQHMPEFKAVLLSITDKLGSLEETLTIIRQAGLSMTKIESRPSTTPDWDYDIFIEFSQATEEQIHKLVENVTVSGVCTLRNILHSNPDKSGVCKYHCTQSAYTLDGSIY